MVCNLRLITMNHYNSAMNKFLFIIIIMFSTASSQTYWVKYGWEVFKSAGDARILSLGGSAVTDYGTSVSPLFNPASSNRVGLHNFNYTHQSRLAGMINSDLIGFPIKGYSRPLNFILMHEGIDHIPDTRNILLDFGYDGVPGTGDIGEGNGLLDEGERLDENKIKYFSQRQFGFHLSTAWEKRGLTYGIALKGLNHSLGEYSAFGVGLDFGILAVPWDNGHIGLTIQDISTSWLVWDSGTVERFKPTIISGISHTYVFKDSPISLNGMANFIWELSGKSLDDDLNFGNHGGKLLLGVNIIYNQMVAIRIGRNKIGSNTAGVGLSWKNISLDYAFLNEPADSGLGATHLISLSANSEWIFSYIRNI